MNASARRTAFTLIELILAMAACGIILVAIYGVFARALKLRDTATERSRASRVETHAAGILREDLRHARISGGAMAATLEGSQSNSGASFPGFLKFTASTTSHPLARPSGHACEISYYLVNDDSVPGMRSGMLVRTVDFNLLAPIREQPSEQVIMRGLQAMDVAFFDGTTWQESWQHEEGATTTPLAIRVRLHPALEDDRSAKPAPIEILAGWPMQPAIETTTGTAEEQP
jgi:type II secretion system protein J